MIFAQRFRQLARHLSTARLAITIRRCVRAGCGGAWFGQVSGNDGVFIILLFFSVGLVVWEIYFTSGCETHEPRVEFAFRDQLRLGLQPMLHMVPGQRTLVHITEVGFFLATSSVRRKINFVLV